MGAGLTAERGRAAVLVAVDAERAALREEVRLLDDVARQLRGSANGGAGTRDQGKTPGGESRDRQGGDRSKKGTVARSPATTAKRDRDILRFLRDHGPAVSGDLKRVAPNVDPKTRRASLKRLEGKGLVRRSGRDMKPTYEVVGGPEIPEQDQPQAATLGGQLLAFIQEHDGASMAELIVSIDATEEEIRAECGQLIREGEIAYGRRDGDVIFIPQVSA